MKNDEISVKGEKLEMHTGRKWNMARKLKITENEKNTL